MFSEDTIFQFLFQYAYSPIGVYLFVIVFMLLSGFGFPLPEEVVLLSCGIIAFMAHNPHIYPPPIDSSGVAAQGVDMYVLAGVCFFAVILSDTVVYLLGKYHGTKIFRLLAKIRYFFLSNSKKQETSVEILFEKSIQSPVFIKINNLFEKYGALAVGVFRFTPGIRFPGHISCGMMGVPLWKFWLVDVLVALISVPTQVILVATFGEAIISSFKEFKLIILGSAAVLIALYFIKKHYFQKAAR